MNKQEQISALSALKLEERVGMGVFAEKTFLLFNYCVDNWAAA